METSELFTNSKGDQAQDDSTSMKILRNERELDLISKSDSYPSTPSGSSGQEILLNLLSESFEPSQRCQVDNEWSKDYLNRLASLPLESLKHEPIVLQEEETKIRSELAELSFREYKSFIHISTCKTDINQYLESLRSHLLELSSTIPRLEECCSLFTREAAKISEKRAKINTIIDQQENLLNILEIPHLMDICVRNELYSEAMDISTHVSRLVTRYPKVLLIQQIEKEVKSTTQLMLSRLIKLFSEPIKLPSCSKIVGYLRRMEAFDESELRLVFLLSRNSYLQLLMRGIENEKRDPVYYLKKYIDIFREHFFDIVIHYRAVFPDDGGLSSTSSYTLSFSPTIQLFPSTTPSSDNSFSLRPILTASTMLSDYTIYILGQLTSVLSEFIPLISDTSSLSSILTQLMYCGMSLGRVGVDFRHLVTGYFESAVDRIIRKMISDSTQDLIKKFEDAIAKADYSTSWIIDEKRSSSTNFIDFIPSLRSTSSLSTSAASAPFTPLMILLDYPPIAHLTNGYLGAFNSLRLLAPVSLYHQIGNHLSSNLLAIADTLCHYGRFLNDGGYSIRDLQSFCGTFAKIFVPYITRCYVDGVYGGLVQLDEDEGLDEIDSDVNETNNFLIIEKYKIWNSLRDFLPVDSDKDALSYTNGGMFKDSEDKMKEIEVFNQIDMINGHVEDAIKDIKEKNNLNNTPYHSIENIKNN
ncbi:hypothetical protein G9A89_006528 [Geosiphon pyriformis]|nr:hypothetical protein G9A89_006528 [Geosiphon pyriformis]